MKKLFTTLAALFIATTAFALPPVWGEGGEDVAFKYNTHLSPHKCIVTATVTSDDSGNVAAIPLGDEVVGLELYDVPQVYSETDDNFAVTLVSGVGVPLLTKETTSGTTGDSSTVTRRTMINAPWIDVTGLAAGEVAIIVIVFWRDS